MKKKINFRFAFSLYGKTCFPKLKTAIFASNCTNKKLIESTRLSVLLLFFIILTQLTISCELDQPMDSKDCIDVIISGLLHVKTDETPLINIPVQVIWVQSGIYGTNYRVIAGNTTSDGRFIFKTQLDTSLFRSRTLYVRIHSDDLENYVSSKNVWNRGDIYQTFTHFDRTQLQNIEFEFYHKANLKIKYDKTSNEQIYNFAIYYNFDGEDHTVRPLFSYHPFCDSLTVRTAADVMTTISLWKMVSINNAIETHFVSSRSLICKKDADNIVEINF